MSGMVGPDDAGASLRGSYGLAQPTVGGIALVLADVARARGFESGVEVIRRYDDRLVRVHHGGGTLVMRIMGSVERGTPNDIVVPHSVERAVARFEGLLALLETKEGSRHDRLPSSFVGRVDEV